MQTLEAIISMFVFVAFASFLMLQLDNYNGIDDSLYRYQLANDVWRVMYLQGDFKDLKSMSELDQSLGDINEKTGLCVYVSGQQATAPSIRGQDCSSDEAVAKIHPVVLVDGIPKQVTLSLYPSG